MSLPKEVHKLYYLGLITLTLMKSTMTFQSFFKTLDENINKASKRRKTVRVAELVLPPCKFLTTLYSRNHDDLIRSDM